jgi:tetratricopeptide (TPR) repeat protein
LEGAARAFGGHALALSLLAAYVHEIPGHAISHAAEIPDMDLSEAAGRHPRRVMAAWAARLGEGAGLDLLHLLGLFDRPAEAAGLAALRAAPAVPGLNAHLQGMSEGDWLRLLERLRRARLLARASQHRPDDLDTHPLVREHFGAELRDNQPAAWREGHRRLYEYYKSAAPELPDTLEDMAPLFAAVSHGCAAGLHQQILDEVYRRRISREKEFFSVKKLGAYGADLAALAGFFDPPWSQPVDGLRESSKGYVLNEAGFHLRALGRLREAAGPMQAGLEAHIAREVWENAARAAGNLSELCVVLGDPDQALAYARQGVDFADRSGDAFMRMVNRTYLGDALHQAGRRVEAAELFAEAEAMQRERQPGYPLLYSVQGYYYCDLLLDQGEYAEVLRRAAQTIEIARRNRWLLDIALDHLSLGQAHLRLALQAGTGAATSPGTGFAQAAEHLDRAVEGLRRAGTQHHLPRGLLARAALRWAMREYARARRDLEEAMEVATRGEMRLFEADGHLEAARLALAEGDRAGARASLDAARALIAQTGYHRRDAEVAELEEQVRATADS